MYFSCADAETLQALKNGRRRDSNGGSALKAVQFIKRKREINLLMSNKERP